MGYAVSARSDGVNIGNESFLIIKFLFERVLLKAPQYRYNVNIALLINLQHSYTYMYFCRSMLSLGQSKPWPEAMRVMTGQPDFKTDALFNYFKPLRDWLEEQNEGEIKGW